MSLARNIKTTSTEEDKLLLRATEGGAGRAHAWSKEPRGWTPMTVESGGTETSDPQACVDAEMETWRKIWEAELGDTEPIAKLPEDLEEQLKLMEEASKAKVEEGGVVVVFYRWSPSLLHFLITIIWCVSGIDRGGVYF